MGTPKVVERATLFLIAAVLILVLFRLDLAGSPDINISILYTLVVLYAWLLPGRFTVHAIGAFCTALIFVSLLFKYEMYPENQAMVLNGFFNISAVWISVVLVTIAQRGYSRLEENMRDLDKIIRIRTLALRNYVLKLEMQKREIKESNEEITLLNENLLANQKLIESSNARFRKLMEGAVVGLLIIDQNGVILEHNIFFKHLMKSEDQLYGEKLEKYIHDKDKSIFLDYFDLATKHIGGAYKSASIELRLLPLEGQAIFAGLAINALPYHTRKEFVLSIFDLTDRKQKEALRIRTKEIEAKNKEVEHMAYLASHDLQEPLKTIEGFINLFEQKLSSDKDEEAIVYLDYMKNASRRMGELIRYLLSYSKLGTGEKEEVVSIEKIIEELKMDLESLIKRKKGRLLIKDLPHAKDANAFELRVLFQNLISNAFKFVPIGREPQVEVGQVSMDGINYYYVKDNGIGIPENQREKIFQMFHRLRSKTEFEGTGIGLAFCKKIVEQHHGRMIVESTEGEGSCFYFSLNSL